MSDASNPDTYGNTSGGQTASGGGLGDFINNLINTYWTQPQVATGQAVSSFGNAMNPFGPTAAPPGQGAQPNAQGAGTNNTLAALMQVLGPALAQRQQAQQQRKPSVIGGSGGAGAAGGGQVITAPPVVNGPNSGI